MEQSKLDQTVNVYLEFTGKSSIRGKYYQEKSCNLYRSSVVLTAAMGSIAHLRRRWWLGRWISKSFDIHRLNSDFLVFLLVLDALKNGMLVPLLHRPQLEIKLVHLRGPII